MEDNELELDLAAEDVEGLLRVVSGESGVDFASYRTPLLERRIARRARRVGSESGAAYLGLVERSRPERQALFEELLIDVSGFFRDPEVFDLLERRVLPDLVAAAVEAGGSLRIWSAACATGEEPYSLAMLATEVAERVGAESLEIHVFAGDVNTSALNKASSGIYSGEETEDLSEERLARFFSPAPGGHRVEPSLRSKITFTRHNVLSDPGFVRLDLAVCRNLLIYLEPAAQQTVLRSLASGLRAEGALVLGTAEDLGGLATDFEPVERPARVFLKTGSEARLAQSRAAMQHDRPPARAVPTVSPVAPDQRLVRAYDAILDAHLSAALLVGEQRELVHTFGSATGWLRHPEGRSTLDVLDLIADPALKTAISSIIRELREHPDEVSGRPVLIKGPDGPLTADLIGRRIDVGGAVYHLLHAIPSTILRSSVPAAHPDLVADEARAADVAFLRDSLQTAIDDLERANGDLASTNEEVVAANEELQSANEELSSVNEELRSLNDEHQRRLQEVLEVSTDLEFLLGDIALGVVFLDERFVVRRSSDAARRYFRLRPDEDEQRIDELVTHLDVPDLVEIVGQVWESGTPYRARVGHLADRSMSIGLAVSRFDRGTDRTGIVITVGDLSAIVSMETNQSRFIRMLNRGPVSLFAKDGAGRFWYKNRLAEAFIGPGLGGTTHDSYSDELAARLVADDALVTRTGRAVQRVQSLPLGGEMVDTLIVKFPLEDGGVGGLGIELQHSEQLAASSELRGLDATVEVLTLAVIEQIGTTLIDRGGRFQHLTGYSPDGWLSRVHSEDRSRVEQALAMPESDPVFRMLEAGGGWRSVELRVIDENSGAHRFLVFVDRHETVSTVEGLRTRLREAESHRLPAGEMVDEERSQIVQQRIDRAIGGISRQFRRRLATVDAFADMLEQDLAANEGALKNLGRLRDANAWLGSVTDSLDRLVTVGSRPLSSGPARLDRIVAAVVTDLAEPLDAVDATVVVGDLPTVTADPDGVGIVVRELLRNAIDHRSPDGGPRIEISAEERSDGVVLSMTDDGVGFDQEDAVKIFQPFHRGSSGDAEAGGVGIGLTLARRLVRRMGGDIWARSSPDGGASFHVHLPAAVDVGGSTSDPG